MKNIFTFCFILLFIFSCEKDKSLDEFVLRIKENKIRCTGYEGQTECYLIQKGSKIDSEEWEYFYEQIDGFDYQVGFVYKILVTKERIDTPPI